jgi:hypothetical protein
VTWLACFAVRFATATACELSAAQLMSCMCCMCILFLCCCFVINECTVTGHCLVCVSCAHLPCSAARAQHDVVLLLLGVS